MIQRRYLRDFCMGVLCVVWWLAGPQAAPQGTASGGKARVFSDPAPPRIEKLSPMNPPTTTLHPDVKVHATPRFLPRGAVTHAWKSFLGPTHNAVSSETKLLKSWPTS